MNALPISPAYREAVRVALVLQVVAALLLLMILDGGVLAKVGGAAMIGFWIGVAAIMVRRPMTPSAVDLLYVRWGYVPLLLLAVAFSPFIAGLLG